MGDVKSAIRQRLEMLRGLGENHGGEGEKAPNQRSFDYAFEVLATHYVGVPFVTTFSSNGEAVFEFHGNGKYTYADITFLDDGSVSCYRQVEGKASEQFIVPHTSDKFTLFFQQLVG